MAWEVVERGLAALIKSSQTYNPFSRFIYAYPFKTKPTSYSEVTTAANRSGTSGGTAMTSPWVGLSVNRAAFSYSGEMVFTGLTAGDTISALVFSGHHLNPEAQTSAGVLVVEIEPIVVPSNGSITIGANTIEIDFDIDPDNAGELERIAFYNPTSPAQEFTNDVNRLFYSMLVYPANAGVSPGHLFGMYMENLGEFPSYNFNGVAPYFDFKRPDYNSTNMEYDFLKNPSRSMVCSRDVTLNYIGLFLNQYENSASSIPESWSDEGSHVMLCYTNITPIVLTAGKTFIIPSDVIQLPALV